MEALGTLKAIQEIADRAAGGYEHNVDGCPESYADWIIEWYQTSDCPEPIRSNSYYQALLEQYASTIKNQVIRKIKESR